MPKPATVPRGDGRDDRGVPELLAGVRVGDVHLDQRRGALRGRVPHPVRVVGERTGVENDRNRAVRRLVQPADHLALVVGLPDLDVEAELLAERLAALDEPGVGGRAVDVGLAGAEPAEVRAVEHAAPRRAHADDLRVRGEQHAPGRGPPARPAWPARRGR